MLNACQALLNGRFLNFLCHHFGYNRGQYFYLCQIIIYPTETVQAAKAGLYSQTRGPWAELWSHDEVVLPGSSPHCCGYPAL